MKRMVETVGLLAIALVVVGCGDGGQSRLRRMMGPSPKELAAQLDSEDADLRRDAIERLSRKDRGQREPYLKLYAAFTKDADPTVRSAALRALGRAEDPTYVKEVAAALADSDEQVRCDAATALDTVVGSEAVGPLRKSATADEYDQVRTACAKALRHYPSKEVLTTLIECLSDEQITVRHQAGQSLSELTGEDPSTDADYWRAVLAAKDDPFAPPPKQSRPWWQWLWWPKPATQPSPTPAPAE